MKIIHNNLFFSILLNSPFYGLMFVVEHCWCYEWKLSKPAMKKIYYEIGPLLTLITRKTHCIITILRETSSNVIAQSLFNPLIARVQFRKLLPFKIEDTKIDLTLTKNPQRVDSAITILKDFFLKWHGACQTFYKSMARIKLKLADKSISCEKFSTGKVSAKNRLFWENNNLNFMALKKRELLWILE